MRELNNKSLFPALINRIFSPVGFEHAIHKPRRKIVMYKPKRQIYIWIILIAMATAFSFAIDVWGKNMVLISIMAIIPFLLVSQFPYIRKSEMLIYALPIAIIASASLLRYSPLSRPKYQEIKIVAG